MTMDGTTGAGVGTTGVGEAIMAGTTLGAGTTGAGEATMAGTTHGVGTTGAGEATVGDGTTGVGIDGTVGDGPEIMAGAVIMVTCTTEITEGTMHIPIIELDAVTTIRITMALQL